MGCCIGDLHTVETRFYCMGFGFELDTTDFLYKECVIRMNRYSFSPKKTYYTRIIRNGLTTVVFAVLNAVVSVRYSAGIIHFWWTSSGALGVRHCALCVLSKTRSEVEGFIDLST